MKKFMQCKDIDEKPILKFLANLDRPATAFDGYAHSVISAMPDVSSNNLAIAKMSQLIKKGLVKGCTCGCRGDFEITQKGRELIN